MQNLELIGAEMVGAGGGGGGTLLMAQETLLSGLRSSYSYKPLGGCGFILITIFSADSSMVSVRAKMEIVAVVDPDKNTILNIPGGNPVNE